MSDTGVHEADQDETLETVQHQAETPGKDTCKTEKKEEQPLVSHASTFMIKNALRTAKSKTKTSQGPDEIVAKLQKDKDMLEKQFDRRNAEFSKAKALLEQRNSLLEMERDEMKERLESQRTHYESILKKLQKEGDGPNIDGHLNSLKKSQEEYEKETSQYRKKYEKEIIDLKLKMNMLVLSEKDMKEQLKTQKHEYKLKAKKHEVVVKELEFSLSQVTSEKDKIISSLHERLDRIEAKYGKELDDMKSKGFTDLQNQQREYENKLDDIKYLHEQEQASLKNRIRKLEDELALMKDSENLTDQSMDFDFENDRAKEMQLRMSMINDKLSEDMLQAEKQQLAELNDLRKENTNLKVTIEQLKAQLSRNELESSQKYSRLEAKYSEKCHEADKAQSSVKEVIKLNKKVDKYKLKIGQIEETKQKLKDIIKQKDYELETERIAKKRAILAEQKKVKLQTDKANDLQRQVDQKTAEIEDLKRENLNQSEAANDWKFFSPSSRPVGGSSKNITLTDNRAISRRMKMESPKALGSATNFTEASEYHSSKDIVDSNQRMVSLSPDKAGVELSGKTVHVVTSVNLKHSDKKLHFIPSSQVNLYDDMYKHANGKYCEACKYKKWRIEQLKYDPEKLLYNRDIIKYITCLGCERALEVKDFLKHTRDCRLSNHIPHIDGSKYYNKYQIHSRRFSNNPHSMNRSDKMGSDIGGDIRNMYVTYVQKCKDLHSPGKMSNNSFNYRSNDNLLRPRRKRIESGDKYSMKLYPKSKMFTNYQNGFKQNEKLFSENEESSGYTSSKFDNSKVYSVDLRDMDDESEENLKDDNEELSVDDKGNVGAYKSKIHSFSNMFQSTQHIEQVSKKDFDALKSEVMQLRDRHYIGQQLETPTRAKEEPQSVGGSRGNVPKNRTSLEKPLGTDSIENSAVGYSMSQALNRLNFSSRKH